MDAPYTLRLSDDRSDALDADVAEKMLAHGLAVPVEGREREVALTDEGVRMLDNYLRMSSNPGMN